MWMKIRMALVCALMRLFPRTALPLYYFANQMNDFHVVQTQSSKQLSIFQKFLERINLHRISLKTNKVTEKSMAQECPVSKESLNVH